ncbi:hypothetical protein D9756_008486 [Leucocoprinus leucothites]|uniref:Uncharacterized protein n=1 Tax=Leucocoprinus leucothites TaxID=201217 RepID=A0A8H5CZ95_9AGAR|nr:hypothetical protein D9756_008486 [Leucoagaricus leucothites]
MDSLLYYLGQAGTEEVALSVTPPAATVEDVLKDFQEMETQGTALRDAIRDFPETGGTLITALAIHNNTVELQNQIVPLPISLEDGTKVIDAIGHLKPLLDEAMRLMVEKKTAFEQLSIGVPSIIKFDLTTLHDSVVALENALIAASPAELLETAQTIKAEIEAIFENAIVAYS